MQIRQLTDQEFDERVELSMYAFQYELTAEEMTEARSRFKLGKASTKKAGSRVPTLPHCFTFLALHSLALWTLFLKQQP